MIVIIAMIIMAVRIGTARIVQTARIGIIIVRDARTGIAQTDPIVRIGIIRVVRKAIMAVRARIAITDLYLV